MQPSRPGLPAGKRLSPVDEWWNRSFPPHSGRRLLFFLAVYPLVGLLVEAGTGIVMGALMKEGTGVLTGGFSWIRYVLITLSGMGVLTLLWLSGSLRPQGGRRSRPTRSEPKPSEGGPVHRNEARAPDQSDRISPGLASLRADPVYRPNLADFLTGIPFGVACFLCVNWAMEQELSAILLLESLGGGVFISATVVLRYTIWAPILVSLVGGAGIGVFLMLFGMFMGGPEGFLVNWGMGSLIAALFVFPAWRSLAACSPARLIGREVPMWVMMTGMLILIAGVSLLVRLTEGQ